ncbi:hypothetical protein [Catellatospora citrea]|uniref:Galactose mutarotase-like enzyme n=1 Tax=Catellatospora citrea TaxID=53366 RepID=A0A8J3KIV1_9ACTN|nr:hypothetical protein [Catellatospora citrea]RKE11302.1 hypothetical protein C8E86_6226 [Catellatospora citrea]GIF96769.1 hypothetical protein Cci01nite_18630 [Catellatospora citrea]
MVTDAPVALRAVLDPAHGGRWTSLSGGGREWLWTRPGTGRDAVAPGDDFVDAGGLEECLPTVRGLPDHGDLWSRPWQRHPDEADPGGTMTIARPAFILTRRVREHSGAIVADYTLAADPGHRFVWAAHALLDLSPAARLDAPAGTTTRLYPEAAPLLVGPWPDDLPWREGPWPAPAGLSLDRFGPDDGTALGAILTDCPTVHVTDGSDRLTLHLDCDGQPRSTALWRNLRGWPQPDPYRSIGVEPMLGAAFDLAGAGPGDAATVPASGQVSWRLTITAHRRGGTTP